MTMEGAPFDFAGTSNQQNPGHEIFQAVVDGDFESLAKTFAINARNSLISYMSMKSRWARQQESLAKSGEIEERGTYARFPLFPCERSEFSDVFHSAVTGIFVLA